MAEQEAQGGDGPEHDPPEESALPPRLVLTQSLGGQIVTEQVFAIPGLGRYFVQSIQAYDYTMISGTTIFYGAFLILANLVVDLVYGIIDPRVKLEEG